MTEDKYNIKYAAAAVRGHLFCARGRQIYARRCARMAGVQQLYYRLRSRLSKG